jgi:membrane associated rhomboid family serine protease
MIPISTDTPVRRTPWVNYGLIGVNVAIFVIEALAHSAAAGGPATAALAIREWGALRGDEPQLYQFFSYQFLHGGPAHIAGNMLFLWVFGNPVNAKMGHGPYLLFYLAGGVFAATGYGYFSDHTMIGASGSIAAVTTAYLALFPRSHVTIIYWFIIIGYFELPGVWLILFKMILWDNMIAPRMIDESNVAFGAHLAGYGFGFAAVAIMLALRVLPRDQFDIVALWRRWWQRQSMKTTMADPEARARAQYGRVARPILAQDVPIALPRNPQEERISELRSQIAEALAAHHRDEAAQLYEKLLEIDPKQVLPRTQQLDVANQLYTQHKLPQAAAAYERYLTHYSPSPEADQVKLLLGIIYARDLQQYEVAEAHLSQLLERLVDDRRREQCRHWLQVVSQALGRPAAG